MEKQHGQPSQKHLKFYPWHVYHIYWSLWNELSSKKSLLVIFKILRLFVSTLTAYDKSSVLNREYLMHPIHMQISQKERFSQNFFLHFRNLDCIFNIFKRKLTFIANVFPKWGNSEIWLDKYPKSTTSEHRCRSNMVNGVKHCWNLNGGTFIIFIDHSEDNWVRKSHS